MSNELVVEADDSAPMSQVSSPNQMDAIEELQEEEDAEQEWAPAAQEENLELWRRTARLWAVD